MTTTLDPSTVATMQGRELDRAIATTLCGWREVKWRNYGKDERWDGVNELDGYPSDQDAAKWQLRPDEIVDVPHYSTDPTAFFAMVERVRQSGWNYRIWSDDGRSDGNKIQVELWKTVTVPTPGNGRRTSADTLPLAFARAALLTTIPKGEQ